MYSHIFRAGSGNVFAYREVNRIGRETVVAAMNVTLREGFEVTYLDTDSVFVKRQNANLDGFLRLGGKIENETRFEISLAHHYRYLILLAQEADPEIEAARRFYGRLADGRLYYRGIELRRHDYPVFMKRFQQNLFEILLGAETAQEVTSWQLNRAIAGGTSAIVLGLVTAVYIIWKRTRKTMSADSSARANWKKCEVTMAQVVDVPE